MYDLVVSEKAKGQLKKLPEEARDRIGNALERAKIRPHHFVKRVVGTNYFRLRAGDYRIIQDIKNRELIILVIELGHRRNICK